MGNPIMSTTHLTCLAEKYRDRWKWCTLCRVAIVGFDCCSGTTCNCRQCDQCKVAQDEVRELGRAGLAPSIEDIPGAPAKQRQHDIDWIKNKLNCGESEADVDWWISACKEHGQPVSVFARVADIPPEELAASKGIGLLGE